jgi:heme iron utilization protein
MSSERAALALTARQLMRRTRRASLATLGQGWPYASSVLVATDGDATPLLLLSDLAEHSKNIAGDSRVSLLFDGGSGEDLSAPRLTVLGEAVRDDAASSKARYFTCHPAAAPYFGFRDFRLLRLKVSRAHFVAGFGRIDWLAAAELLLPEDAARAVADAAPDLVAEVNDRHCHAIDRIAAMVSEAPMQGWQVLAIDADGLDIGCGDARGRLDFDRAVASADDARAAVARLTAAARASGKNRDTTSH